MEVSLGITTFNEERTIGDLIESLLSQTKKPDEIIVVDSHSTDQTADIVRYYRKKDKSIKLISEKCSRAKGRNIAVKHASNEIIVMTDAGCIPHEDWLEKIIEPFKDNGIDIVAGFYDMETETPLKKAFSVFLGTTPRKFDPSFMPSTRSIAFTKNAWVKAGGFPENLDGAAEDTIFNYKAIKNDLHFYRVKKARVIWQMPADLKEYASKIYGYAQGDSRSKVWSFPSAGMLSHNMRVFSKIILYLLGVVLFSMGTVDPFWGRIFFLFLVLYILNSFRKVFLEYEDLKSALWAPVVQFTTDFASIFGFLDGFFPPVTERRIRKSLQTTQ